MLSSNFPTSKQSFCLWFFLVTYIKVAENDNDDVAGEITIIINFYYYVLR